LGRFIKGIVLLALALGGLRVGRPHLKSYQFARMVKDEVEAYTVRPHPRQIHQRVLELGRLYGLDLQDGDVTVAPIGNGGFEISVHYEVPVDLYFHQYVKRFDHVSRTKNAGVPQ
jgi:hypothetical protein